MRRCFSVGVAICHVGDPIHRRKVVFLSSISISPPQSSSVQSTSSRVEGGCPGRLGPCCTAGKYLVQKRTGSFAQWLLDILKPNHLSCNQLMINGRPMPSALLEQKNCCKHFWLLSCHCSPQRPTMLLILHLSTGFQITLLQEIPTQYSLPSIFSRRWLC